MEIENLKFDENGLIPAIIQDAETKTVLMLGYMNREALTLTLTNGKVCFFSRSRQKLWTKGEESGHFLYLKDIQADCDGDTLLVNRSDRLAILEQIPVGERRMRRRIFCSSYKSSCKKGKMILRKSPIRPV